MNIDDETGGSSGWGHFPSGGQFSLNTPAPVDGDSYADMLAGAQGPSIFILTDGHGGAPVDASHMAQALGYRILGQCAVADGAQRLQQIVDVDVFLLCCSWQEAGLDLLLTRLDAIASVQGASLVIATSLGGVDQVYAMTATSQPVILCDPNAADMVSALALMSVRASDRLQLHDISRDAGNRRLDRLSDELVRLNQMVASLVQGRSPDHSPMSAWQDGAASMGAQDDTVSLHSGGRDFTVFPEDAGKPLAAPSPVTAQQIRAMLRMRRMREKIFKTDIFADPAWDILLDLMAARLEDIRVSVSSLCIAAAVPPTTALRWIKQLTDCGLLERQADPEDGRRIFITLSDAGAESIQRWFRESASQMALVNQKMSGKKRTGQ